LSGLCGLFLVLGPVAGQAAQWRVNPEGTGDVASIQDAIDAAASQDTVLLAPGTYFPGPLLVQNKGLTIRGEEGVEATILDGGQSYRILTAQTTGAAVILDQLTFRNGAEEHGGAVAAFASPLLVTDCFFQKNRATSGLGGAVLATTFLAANNGASEPLQSLGLILTRCTFEDNLASADGGALHSNQVASLYIDCVFRANSAVLGAGVSLLHNNHAFSGCRFENNNAAVGGGGLYFAGHGTVDIEETLFENNFADDFGGGLRAVSTMGMTLRKCWFVNNRALQGAGASILRTVITAENVLWLGNIAEERSGGIFVDNEGDNSFTRCTWVKNTAPFGASFTLRHGAFSVRQSLVADEHVKSAECVGERALTSTCNLGGSTTGDCLTFQRRVTVEVCETFPQGLCSLHSSTCGPVGHTDQICPPGTCTTPVDPITWGKLKSRYR
jgi:predicted outer membrane repeat protein